MRRNIRSALIFFFTVPLLATGCTATRFVTAELWAGGDVNYVAYTEAIPYSTSTAKVTKCLRTENNTLQCEEQEELNRLLNQK